MLKYKIIAVDIDGTILNSKYSYPYVDSINEDAIATLNRYHNLGGKIILWTLRTDEHLDIALEALHSLYYDAVNNNLKESIDDWDSKYPGMTYSPKVCCDLFIDDRNWPCNIIGIDWKALEKELCESYTNN